MTKIQETFITLAAGALFLAAALLLNNVYDRPRRAAAAPPTPPATPVQGAPCAPAGVAGEWSHVGVGYGR